MSVPAFQAQAPRQGWFRDWDGVWAIHAHESDSQEYRFDLDQHLGASEYISSVSWESFGPTLSGASSAVQAKGTCTFSGAPSNNETMVLNNTTITAKSSEVTSVDEFLAGASAAVAAANLAACINSGSESANVTAVDNGDGTVTLTWVEYGTDGNDVILTSSILNMDVDGDGYLGGTQAGTTEGGVDGKSHVVTATGYGDAEVTVVTTEPRTFVQRYRWLSIRRPRDDYR